LKPSCYGSLNCAEGYDCPLTESCGEALVYELESVPLEAWRIIQRKLVTRTVQKQVMKRRRETLLSKRSKFFKPFSSKSEPSMSTSGEQTYKAPNNPNKGDSEK